MSSKHLRTQLPLLPSERECHSSGDNAKTVDLLIGQVDSDTIPHKEEEVALLPEAAPAVESETGTAVNDEEDEKDQSEKLRRYQESTFASHPPLPSASTSVVLQDFLSSTCRFMNAFASDVDDKLDKCTQTISRLETQTGLLEGKLASVPCPSTSTDDAERGEKV